MAIIPGKQGAVKLSEVSTDSAFPFYQIQEREDGLTVQEALRRVAVDQIRKNHLTLSSSGQITWNGTSSSLTIPNGVYIRLVGVKNAAEATSNFIDLRVVGPVTFTINNNELLYIEVNRALLNNSNFNTPVNLTDGINGAGTPGQRIRKYTLGTLPKKQEGNDGRDLVSLPIALRQDGRSGADKNLWWIPHGILWPNQVTAVIGSYVVPAGPPIGSIAYIWVDPTDVSVVTQAYIDSIAPGWQLCNGSLITNPDSPFLNLHTPNLNGELFPASGRNVLIAKAQVTAGSNIAKILNFNTLVPDVTNVFIGQEIQSVNPGIAAGTIVTDFRSTVAPGIDTFNFDHEIIMSNNATVTGTIDVRMGLPTFLRGDTTSPQDHNNNNDNNYDGSNSHQLTVSQMASHTHSTGVSGNHKHLPSADLQAVPAGHYGLAVRSGGGSNTTTGGSASSGKWDSNNAWNPTIAPNGDSGTPDGGWTSHDHNGTVLSGGAKLSNANTGNAVPHVNQPQCFDLIAIMRIV
jgi:hypothetical protein